MLVDKVGSIHSALDIIQNISVDPDINIEYFIPGILVTTENKGQSQSRGPYIQFEYTVNGESQPHIQHMPLTHGFIDKTPEDLANFVTFSVE